MKLLKILLITFAIIVLALLAIFFFARDEIITSAINKAGDKILKTDVSVKSVHSSLSDGSIEITNFKISNPGNGFAGDTLAKFATVEAQVEKASVFSDVIVIKNVIINAPEFYYEFDKDGRSNITALLENLKSEATTSSAHEKAEAKEASNKKVVIKNLEINSAKAAVSSKFAGVALQKEINIPNIKLTNLGTEDNPTTFGKVAEELSAVVLNGITKSDEFKQLFDFKKLGDDKLQEKINKSIEKLGGKLNKLF
jgi:uncharacterized protein involved in outer membrane biogenesis